MRALRLAALGAYRYNGFNVPGRQNEVERWARWRAFQRVQVERLARQLSQVPPGRARPLELRLQRLRSLT